MEERAGGYGTEYFQQRNSAEMPATGECVLDWEEVDGTGSKKIEQITVSLVSIFEASIMQTLDEEVSLCTIKSCSNSLPCCQSCVSYPGTGFKLTFFFARITSHRLKGFL